MIQMNILFFTLLFSLPLSLSASLKSASGLSTELKGNHFTAKLKKGFHFNSQAPNNLVLNDMEFSPTLLKPRQVQFTLPQIKNKSTASKSAVANLYVCDDAKTYCDTHHLPVFPNATERKAPSPMKSTEFENLLKQAKTEQKLILLDFAARWCPGCIRYEKEVFPTAAFRDMTSGMLVMKVDVDLFQNFALAEKFQIQGIPSLVILNSEGQEISRLVDFKPVVNLRDFIVRAEQNALTKDQLIARSETANESEKLIIGQKLLAMNHFIESELVFSKMKATPPEIWSARVENAKLKFKEKSDEKKGYIDILQKAIATEPEGTRSLVWRTELIPLLGEKSQEGMQNLLEGKKTITLLLQNQTKLAQAFQHDSSGEFTGFEKMLVAQLGVDLLETAKSDEADVAKMWDRAVEVSQEYKISPEQSGPALRYLIFLSAAKKFEMAEAWVNQMIAVDLNNLDLQRRKMRILLGLNKNQEAIQIGEKIISKAEGRNQFWVADLLAKAYFANQKKKEAKKLLLSYLAKPEMDSAKMKSAKIEFEKLLDSTTK